MQTGEKKMIGGRRADIIWQIGCYGLGSLGQKKQRRLFGKVEPTTNPDTTAINYNADKGRVYEKYVQRNVPTAYQKGFQVFKHDIFWQHIQPVVECDFYFDGIGIECKARKKDVIDLFEYQTQLQWYYFCGVRKVFLLSQCFEGDCTGTGENITSKNEIFYIAPNPNMQRIFEIGCNELNQHFHLFKY